MCARTYWLTHAHIRRMRNPLASVGNASHMALPLSLHLLKVHIFDS